MEGSQYDPETESGLELSGRHNRARSTFEWICWDLDEGDGGLEPEGEGEAEIEGQGEAEVESEGELREVDHDPGESEGERDQSSQEVEVDGQREESEGKESESDEKEQYGRRVVTSRRRDVIESGSEKSEEHHYADNEDEEVDQARSPRSPVEEKDETHTLQSAPEIRDVFGDSDEEEPAEYTVQNKFEEDSIRSPLEDEGSYGRGLKPEDMVPDEDMQYESEEENIEVKIKEKPVGPPLELEIPFHPPPAHPDKGSRLTAFELVHDNIPTTLIADSAAAALMKTRRVDGVIVGADRVAANGDTANKIGTYSLAVCALRHGIPFYVAAPLTSIDLSLSSGEEIVIDERSAKELLHSRGGLGEQVVASGIPVWSPAFDVTLACVISGIITEKAQMLANAWEYTSADQFLHCLPLHHVHGLFNALLAPLYAGSTVEFMPKFSVRGIWQRWRESYPEDGTKAEGAISVFTGVPTIYTQLIQGYEAMDPELKEASASATSKLRLMMCGSSALPYPVMQQWKTITGHRLLERYGMTEFVMALSNPLKGNRKGGTVGKPFPGVQAKILAEDGTGDDTTGVGELCIKSPSLFKEYWKLSESTA
ncbi:uncharacterized protein LOC130775420 [Actinidia eriantha]|uniref:uncharacterized protein LOC130775420 n=1 Tax=Actinidia eriantha TaxID=165200 RepID=UPI00258A4F5D|nr:uncharacterized protein LOC130775420 [Actinidia eriantha]